MVFIRSASRKNFNNYPEHMFSLRNKKKKKYLDTPLIWSYDFHDYCFYVVESEYERKWIN